MASTQCQPAAKPPHSPGPARKDGHTRRERHSGCPAWAPTQPGCRRVRRLVSVAPAVGDGAARSQPRHRQGSVIGGGHGGGGGGGRRSALTPGRPPAWFRGCGGLRFISLPPIPVPGPPSSSCLWFPWCNYLLSLNCLSFQSAYFVLLQKYTFLAKVMEFAAK